ncbi:MAG TPA: NAD-binding protein, partial [Methylophilaceae bacterium]|nr:NAD-binding protein [Methylophilaceae bacterium]
LIIATPDAFSVRQIVDIARTLNPAIEVVVRTHSDEEAALLEREGVGKIFMGEHELAAGMAKHALARRGLFEPT